RHKLGDVPQSCRMLKLQTASPGSAAAINRPPHRSSIMSTMRAVQVSRAGGPLELIERPVPEPGRGEVRIKVKACGICHSDAITKDGTAPGIQFPRVPGHEVIGTIDAAGPDVPARWTVGQQVGVGWHAWHC